MWLRLAVIAVLLVPLRATAETIVPGTEYAGPIRLSTPDSSVTHVVPAGWVGSVPTTSDEFTLSHASLNGQIGMRVMLENAQGAYALLNSVMPLGNGWLLVPTSQLGRVGNNAFGRDYIVQNAGMPLLARVYNIFGKFGVGVLVIAIADASSAEATWEAAAHVQRSLRFARPAVPQARATPPAAEPPMTQERQPVGQTVFDLTGRQLVRMKTSNGYSFSKYFTFCSNGRFTWRTSESSVSQNGTVGLNDANRGSYQQTGDRVELQWDDGDTSSLSIRLEGDQVFLGDNAWWFRKADC